MGINVKAVERKIAYLSKEKDVYMYVMQPMFYCLFINMVDS